MPARHALLIGNSTFRHTELKRLSAPANDVSELAALLKDLDIGGFTVELKLDVGLVDARKAIKRLFANRHPDDLVLFYYSGHGLLDTHGRFYLAMTETDPADPDAGSIDETWLRGVFDGSLSGRQVAILDCCHSGAFIPGGATAKDGVGGPILTEKTFDPTGRGRFIMAATTATTSAFEQDGRSLYTRHLVEGLTGGAAAPEKETVNVLDLHAFVKRRVAESAAPAMRPQLWRDAALNPDAYGLVIARNPRPRPKLPDEDVRDLWSDEPKDVELAIFRLIEIAKEDGSRAQDARRVLGERLEASDSLSYKLGARIEAFLSASKVGEALDAANRRAEEADALIRKAEERAAEENERARRAEERAAEADDTTRKAAERAAEEGERARRAVELAAKADERARKAEDRVAAAIRDAADANDRLEAAEQAFETVAKRATEAERSADALAQENHRLKLTRLAASLPNNTDVQTLRDALKNEQVRTASVTAELEKVKKDREHISARAHAMKVDYHDWRRTSTIVMLVLVGIAVWGWYRVASVPGDGAALAACEEARPEQCPSGSSFVERDAFPVMVVIPSGRFYMGSPIDESGRESNEGPRQTIAIERFALAQSEVTIGQWMACVADGGCKSSRAVHDGGEPLATHPVSRASWINARDYIDWLNSKVEGEPYRLPSEAEWEYAARAGEQAAYPWGADWNAALANGASAVGRLTDTGSYPPNAFGLVDMIGNVWEWTGDCWRPNLRDQPRNGEAVTEELGANCTNGVGRGGSWRAEPSHLRSAKRQVISRQVNFGRLGFRPARTLAE